jgi:uncharacterized protein YycO
VENGYQKLVLKIISLKIFVAILMVAMLSGSSVFIADKISIQISIDERLLQDGDVIFRRGTDAVSRAILTGDTGSNYSHVGLIVKRHHHAYVLHAIPAEASGEEDIVKVEPLTIFISSRRSIAVSVLRLKNNAKARGKLAVDYAQSRVGAPFDFSFDGEDDSNLYCTELVWRAYEVAGVQIVNAAKLINVPMLASNVVPPSAVYKADAFQEINITVN